MTLILTACEPAERDEAQAPPPPAETATVTDAVQTPEPTSEPTPTPVPERPTFFGDKLTTDGLSLNTGRPGVARISWTTESEESIFGFNVMRSSNPDGEFKQVNDRPIQGAGNSSTRRTYEYYDRSVKVGEVYYYYIQEIGMDGRKTDIKEWTGRVTVNRLDLEKANAQENAATTSSVGLTTATTSAN